MDVPEKHADARPAILHIGPGAFHRAHQAVYADELIRNGHLEAAIREVCLFPPRIGQAHAAQNGQYHVLLRDGKTEELHRISSISEVLDQPHPDMLCDPALRLVTMTLTEKGYCHVPGTRHLNPAAIETDLADPAYPATAIGWIALALDRRREADLPGITLASCDNIPANGRLLEAVLTSYVEDTWPALSSWMKRNVTFPVSMVDRIVPRVDEDMARKITEKSGTQDPLGVVCEPFRQWVMEDRFARPIPPLHEVGVQIVEDVAPYETMKHRILNGAQTALAHLGALSGFATSHEAASDPIMGDWLTRFVVAQSQTLECPPGEDLDAYVASTLERLRNPHIQHPLVQIGTDSSFKLGQRIVEAATHHLDHEDAGLYALTIAAWMQYNTGRDVAGREIPIHDPLVARFREIDQAASGEPEQLVEGYLQLDLFDGPLRRHQGFRKRLVDCCEALAHMTPRDIMASKICTVAEEEKC